MVTDEPTYHKIIFAGLTAVGKTSIYQSVIENADLSTIENLLPTRGIERKFHSFADYNLVFWDLGGQDVYRSNYFRDPRVFANTSLLIYVLDIQDKARFDDSVEYLLQILMTIKNMNDVPRVFVLIHKYDPEKMTDLKFNLLDASNILKEANKFPDMKITKYATSIYSDNLDAVVEGILKEIIPEFSNDLIRQIHESKFDPDVSGEEEILSGMEFTFSKKTEKSDFQMELAKHIDMIRDLVNKDNDRKHHSKSEEE